MPSTRIVCMSSNPDDDMIRECFRRGASGFIPKRVSTTELVHELDRVLHGKTYLSHRLPQSAQLFSGSAFVATEGEGGHSDGAADRSPTVARRGQDEERGCSCAQGDNPYHCIPQVQVNEQTKPQHKCWNRAVRPQASCRLCLT